MAERVKMKSKEGGNYFASPKTDVQFFSSGSKRLDLALGGGWAENRVANIVGDKSSGKTLLCIEACSNFIKKYKDGAIYYREAEAAFDEKYAAALGMPIDHVDFGDDPIQTVEDMFEDITDVVEKSKEPTLYLVDSLDALSSRAELARKIDEASYGTDKARQASALFRRLARSMEQSNVTMLIVSQVRENITTMPFAKKYKRSGGKALDHYASQVVELAQIGVVKKTIAKINQITGLRIKATVTKNKIGLPLRDAEFEIRFGYGIDDVLSALEWLREAGCLGDIEGAKPTKLKDFVRELNKAPDDEYWETVDVIYNALEKRWYEFETRFLPKRKKYIFT